MTTDTRQRKRARTDDNMPHFTGQDATANGVNDHGNPKSNGVNGVNGVNGTNGTNGADGHVDSDEWFVGSVDQGTTSSRFIIFNSQADVVASHQIEFANYYPESGYVLPTIPVRSW